MKTNTLSPPYIFGAKVSGQLHRKNGIPCQDAFSSEIIQPSHIVIAVADGLGTAPLSDLGARCAVEAAVTTVSSLMAEDENDARFLLRSGFAAARRDLFKNAAREIRPIKDLACTLILVLATRDTVSVAHIGDGAVVVKTPGTIQIVSEPENYEYSNIVVPVSSNGWEEALRLNTSAGPVDCVAVFTDGVQNAALQKINLSYQPFEAFFNPLFSYAMQINDCMKAEEEISELLMSSKIGDSSSDDKTLVISVLGEMSPK
jgi:hypothetical protein